jgi:hypothetical protein
MINSEHDILTGFCTFSTHWPNLGEINQQRLLSELGKLDLYDKFMQALDKAGSLTTDVGEIKEQIQQVQKRH